jgi:carbamoyl-phosphate synthase large subunit
MKSVGEAMAIGRTFKESLQKAMRSLETGSFGFEPKVDLSDEKRQASLAIVQEKLKNPNAQRLWYVGDAYRLGMSTDEIFQLSAYDPWFLEKIRELIVTDQEIENHRGKLTNWMPRRCAVGRRWDSPMHALPS